MDEIYDEFYNGGEDFEQSIDDEDPTLEELNETDMVVVHGIEKEDHEIYESEDTINDEPHIRNIDDKDNEGRCRIKVSRYCEMIDFKRKANKSIEFREGVAFKNVDHFREILRESILQVKFECKRIKVDWKRKIVNYLGNNYNQRLHASIY